MQPFWLVVSFIFGSMVGSFLNVVIYRLPREKSILKPARSYCPLCHEQIAWYDNIPLISWFALHGQCRHCGSMISARYVIVEILTAVLFTATYWLCSNRGGYGDAAVYSEFAGVTVIYMALAAVLLAASAMDIELRIIPNSITLGGAMVTPVLSVLVPQLHNNPAFGRTYLFFPSDNVLGPLCACFVGMAVGSGIIWFSGLLGKALFRKDAMGLGDVKFMAMLGGILGWQLVLMLFFASSIIGSVVGLVHILRTKDHHIPFGPSLSAAALVVVHFGDRILIALKLNPLP
jgi:leader peptidase (prepilin peptidase) / N-methyltransferase